jgi:apolipoprotein N-acyltransferase
MLRSPLARAGAAVLGGALLGVAYRAGPWGWLSWFAFVPFWGMLAGASPARAAALGWVYGVVAWAVGLSWLYPTVLKFVPGSLPAATLIYALLLALFGTLFAAIALFARGGALILRRVGRWSPSAAFLGASVPALAAVEGLWPRLFPFSLAEVQSWHLPLFQLSDLAGGATTALLVGLVSAALALLLRVEAGRRPRRSGARRFARSAAAAAVLLLLAAEGYGLLRIRAVDRAVAAVRAAGRSLPVAIVQSSLPTGVWARPHEAPGAARAMGELTRRGAEGGARLVVWPENAYWRPVYFERADRAFERPLAADGGALGPSIAQDVPVAVEALMGSEARVPLGAGEAAALRRHYVGFLRRADGSYGGASAKRFPTPFGEFIPGGRWLPWLYTLTPELVRIRGARQRPLRLADGTWLGVFICYDATKPRATADLVRRGAGLLAEQTSNAAFFDEDQLPRQSLRTTVVRAVETRRFILRAVSSGVSAVIDPVGRVAGTIPFGAREVLHADVAPLDGLTPAVRLGAAGYWAAAAWLAFLGALGVWGAVAKARSPRRL